MIGHKTEQTQENLGKSELVIITERPDDVGLKIGLMMKIGLQEVLDNHIPSDWKLWGLSWGWTAVNRFAYIFVTAHIEKSRFEPILRGCKTRLCRFWCQK